MFPRVARLLSDLLSNLTPPLRTHCRLSMTIHCHDLSRIHVDYQSDMILGLLVTLIALAGFSCAQSESENSETLTSPDLSI